MAGPPFTFDDLEVGMRLRSPGITVTEAHVVAFAGLSGDFNPLHLDETFARKSIFGSRVAHGLLTLALSSGFISMLVAGTALALLEVNARFVKPVRIGDTIYVEGVVVDKRPVEKYDGGVVVVRSEVKNQDGDVVAIVESKLLVSRARLA